MRCPGRARAELDALWQRVFELYAARPAIGTLGAEVVGLALAAEEIVHEDPTGARSAVSRASELLQDLGEPAA